MLILPIGILRIHVLKVNMGKSESELNENDGFLNYCDIMENRKMISELEMRIKALETALMAVQQGVGDGYRHKNDGGWFD